MLPSIGAILPHFHADVKSTQSNRSANVTFLVIGWADAESMGYTSDFFALLMVDTSASMTQETGVLSVFRVSVFC